jgi:hypothetical protein
VRQFGIDALKNGRFVHFGCHDLSLFDLANAYASHTHGAIAVDLKLLEKRRARMPEHAKFYVGISKFFP